MYGRKIAGDVMKTIWCLFHIDNEYYQPDNNLIAWFDTFPTYKMIKDINTAMIDSIDKHISNLLKTNVISIPLIIGSRSPYRGEYRLQEVEAGKFVDYSTGAIKRYKCEK